MIPRITADQLCRGQLTNKRTNTHCITWYEINYIPVELKDIWKNAFLNIIMKLTNRHYSSVIFANDDMHIKLSKIAEAWNQTAEYLESNHADILSQLTI